MRRAQSVRHHTTRPSLALGADDLGMLREGDESNEDILRRQLLEKDRENDRLQTQVQNLMTQLAQRPPIEKIQQLEKEYKNLDLILQGTQRENERCMTELERAKQREKMLERELAKLAGENWQSSLDISPGSVTNSRPSFFHSRSNTLASSIHPSSATTAESSEAQQQATIAHIEQVRLLILGMEQRLQTQEDKLVKSVEKAEHESRKFDQLRKEVTADS
ncbi:hypothetical protein BDN72DRAFT_883434 [Pluteus cervinus]|uniref:Uncharacterized protein n=1 Tax=Pluteus cervinus TaxID=181527 RepID=A0ACD3A685_9AGAR|nr:hypothetical protein BDN72DRAFT_883434 [Pluteus cervinus]